MSKIIHVKGLTFGKYKIVRAVPGGRWKVYCQCGLSKVLRISDIKQNVHGCRSCRSKMKKKNKVVNLLV